MLFSLKPMKPAAPWDDRLLKWSFWALNSRLMLMIGLSLLPVGLLQTGASVEKGYAYARSAEFLQTPLLARLRWLRVPGDTVFAFGAVGLVWVVGTVIVRHLWKEKIGQQ